MAIVPGSIRFDLGFGMMESMMCISLACSNNGIYHGGIGFNNFVSAVFEDRPIINSREMSWRMRDVEYGVWSMELCLIMLNYEVLCIFARQNYGVHIRGPHGAFGSANSELCLVDLPSWSVFQCGLLFDGPFLILWSG